MRRLLTTTAIAFAGAAGAAHAATITEFPLTGSSSDPQPQRIAAAPAGNLWFTETGAHAIGMVTPSGAVAETPGLAGVAYGVTVTAGGDVWVTEPAAGKIAHLTPGGSLSQYSAGIPGGGQPADITRGPDGNLWFTQWTPSAIGKVTPAGTITEYTAGVPAGSDPLSITTGPDGNLWFTESASPGRIGKITPAGVVSQYATGLPASAQPSSITAGPDGNLWFTAAGNPGSIGRITPTGTVTNFASGLTANSNPNAITTGPDGNLWFTESADPGRIGRITPTGTITEYAAGLTANRRPVGIASAGGALWFTEQSPPGHIGRLTPDVPIAATQAASAITPTTATLAGAINPNRAATTYHFDFGTTSNYGQRAPAADAVVGADNTTHTVAQSLTGLLPGTTYHYRVVASSGAGTTYGSDATFTTAVRPSSLPSTGNPLAGPTPAPAHPAPPAMGRSAVAGVVSGTVLVQLRGSSELHPLGAGQNIPLGSLINATHGVVKVTDAIDRRGHTQSATMWAGSFVMSQARTGRGMMTFTLAGPLRCPSAGGVSTAIARSRAPVRLWGKDNHGRYSTRGRNSVATVRGTVWETIDSCAGTRTVVKHGRVSVRDRHRRVTVLVRAGHSYLAKP